MAIESVVTFLERVPPFQFLSGPELEEMTRTMTLEYFPKGSRILSAGSKAAEALYVIEKGGVKLTVTTEDGEEVVLDIRGEGELFGLLSFMGGDVTRLDVTALDDTLCYSLPWLQVQRLITSNADAAGYLLRTSVTRYMDRSLNEIRVRTRLLGDGERLLYSLSASDVLKKPLIVCGERVTVQQAAQIMTEAAATYVVVLDNDGRAAGILTDRDFSQKVVSRGLPLTAPVNEIMNSPVIAVESSDRVFQVLLQMLSHDIHHVLITRDGVPIGVLSNHDLLLLQGKSPLSLGRHVERQETLDQLAAAQTQVNDLIPLLLREGARAAHIMRVTSQINDRVMLKILALAEEYLGPAPVPYCWVVLGSEGRREQTFKTDQDNGLIYRDVPDAQAGQVDDYFDQFTAWVRDALARCGYPPCPGDYMASNPRWRQPVSQWQTYFTYWIGEPEKRRVLDALICFDMRPIVDDCSLYSTVAETRHDLLSTASRFKSILAYLSIMHRPPLGFLRTFVVQRSGENKNQLDLKLFGTGPIVNAARLFALDAGIEQTNTADRLSALQALGYADRNLLQDLQEAWDFLALLRLQRQLQQIEAGQAASNFLDPGTLTNLQRSLLKEAFQAAGRAQSLIESRFQSGIWAHLG